MEVTKLMDLIHEELKNDCWGDIDPEWFKEPEKEDEEDIDEEHLHNYNSLKEVISRALNKYSLKIKN